MTSQRTGVLGLDEAWCCWNCIWHSVIATRKQCTCLTNDALSLLPQLLVRLQQRLDHLACTLHYVRKHAQVQTSHRLLMWVVVKLTSRIVLSWAHQSGRKDNGQIGARHLVAAAVLDHTAVGK